MITHQALSLTDDYGRSRFTAHLASVLAFKPHECESLALMMRPGDPNALAEHVCGLLLRAGVAQIVVMSEDGRMEYTPELGTYLPGLPAPGLLPGLDTKAIDKGEDT